MAKIRTDLMIPLTHPWGQWWGRENHLPVYHLCPGVIGRAFHRGYFVYIHFIRAEREGAGEVGKFLDRLAPDCRIICVVNERLRGMLERRGWKIDHTENGPDGEIDVWKREENTDRG